MSDYTPIPLNILPGIYTEASDRMATNRWKSGLNVRPYKGFMEKIGGSAKAISDSTFLGICRAILAWTSIDQSSYLALGTHIKLYVTDGVSYYDITPVDASGTVANPFTTTISSTSVKVTNTSHGRTAGDYVSFSGAAAVGGITIDGAYVVDSVLDSNNYYITHSSAATSSAGPSGGASVAYTYLLPTGLPDSVVGTGYGGGGYGGGTYGTPRSVPSVQEARVWNETNWGEDLIAGPRGGKAYVWVQDSGISVRAVVITNAPTQNNVLLVSPEDRHLISLGSHDGADFDPMLIRWCDSEDYTDWTPAITNSAGDKRLDNGNEIIVGLLSRGEIVIITDKSVYSMAFDGSDFVFSFKSAGDSIGAMSPHCAVDIDGTVYYMGRGQFMKYTGEATGLDCDVQTAVFGNLNMLQRIKIYAARNKTKNEIIWFYCSADSLEIDKCVGFNYDENVWWLGDVARTSWVDDAALYDTPVATGANGYLYAQEYGVDDDGEALAYSLESYDIEIGADADKGRGPGENVIQIRRWLPDFRRIAGSHTITVTGRKFPNGETKVKGPVAFNAASAKISSRIRARQISLKIESDQIGADISMGGWRADGKAVGVR